jgi:hypothetical protein
MGFLKRITRPISRALDKLVPNEIKPALPFLAAAAPFMAPGIMGAFGNSMLSRGLISGGLNLGSQLAQEGSEGDFSGLSLAMASGIGALSAPGTSSTIGPAGPPGSELITTPGQPSAAQFFETKGASMQPGFAKSGLGALEGTSNYLAGVGDTLQNNLFSKEGLKAAMLPVGQGITDLAIAQNRRDIKDYERDMADYEESMGDDSDNANRAFAIRQSMEAYGFSEQEILDAISAAGYRAGGRVGLRKGGTSEVAGIEAALTLGDDVTTYSNRPTKEVNELDEKGILKKTGDYLFDRGPFGYTTKSIGAAFEEMPEGSKFGDRRFLIYNALLSPAIDALAGLGFGIDIATDIIGSAVSGGAETVSDIVKFASRAMPGDQTAEREAKRKQPVTDMLAALEAEKKSKGGRVGFEFGGITDAVEAVEETPKEFLVDKLKVTVQPGQSEEMGILNAMFNDTDGVMSDDRKMEFYKLYLPQLYERGEITKEQYEGMKQDIFDEDIPKMAEGGLMNLGGREMDMRGGGFIPIGKKERADDVPARLSKNEFVMTADAVRAAGGGSVSEGAKRMYETMNRLEAKV